MYRREFLATGTALAISGPALAQSTSENAELPVVEEMSLGNPDAAVTMIEYASLTCPHCAAFHANVYPQLKADYIDTGKIKFVMREVYFDRNGLWAAMVARCGGADKYFPFTELLYEKQREWISQDAVTTVNNLKALGRVAGMSDAQMDACLQDGPMAQAMVNTYQENAGADGIRATPSFVIQGKLVANSSYDELRAILDGHLNE